jgi:hypothetical protein
MKKIVRLTERDLTRIVRRVMNEGSRIVTPLSDATDIQKGDTMKDQNGTLVHMKNGQDTGLYGFYETLQNPRQVQTDQVGAMNVVSFDPNKKTITFNNGLVIGPS